MFGWHWRANVLKTILTVQFLRLFFCCLTNNLADKEDALLDWHDTQLDWRDTHGMLQFEKTQRGRSMLVVDGYRYVTNRYSNKNTFWRCSHYVKHNCRASVVTTKDLTRLRLAGVRHSHEPFKQIEDWSKLPKSIFYLRLWAVSYAYTFRINIKISDKIEKKHLSQIRIKLHWLPNFEFFLCLFSSPESFN